MPAAAVIPAPLVYINIVVVKTLVVGMNFYYLLFWLYIFVVEGKTSIIKVCN